MKIIPRGGQQERGQEKTFIQSKSYGANYNEQAYEKCRRKEINKRKKQKTKTQTQNMLVVFSGRILSEWLPDVWPALVKSCFILHFVN